MRENLVLDSAGPLATPPDRAAAEALPALETQAVVLEAPERLGLRRLDLTAPGEADVVIDVAWSGISTGTEKLLWTGRMPPFPGMGYPLVPGYESVGRIVWAGPNAGRAVGEEVFVPGARCFGEVRGLFGGAAGRLVVDGARVIPLPERPGGGSLGEEGALFALAATAQHAIAGGDMPDLIVGHGVLGRLLARIAVAQGGDPMVWEINPERQTGAEGYRVVHPDEDGRKDYRAIYDVSGAGQILDQLIMRLARGGEVVLAGFYEAPLSFAFPPAFMKEARLRVAAEFKEPDLAEVKRLIAGGRLDLGGLITHRMPADSAEEAYRTAFGDAACLKMILDWRSCR